MTASILVSTPVRSFGELIKQALEDTDLYRVTLVHSSEQALELIDSGKLPVAVLDLDLDNTPSEIVAKLLALKSDLRIIAMKDESNNENSVLDGLALAARLDGSFYLPDLLDALEIVTSDIKRDAPKITKTPRSMGSSSFQQEKKSTKFTDAPEWLKDVDRAAQHLTRLSLESSAQAALITRKNQLWAYAGQLPKPAADELAQSVAHYWARDGGSDLARFIRLDAVGVEFMLYATGLGGDYVLALAFETEIPFSEIRSQASSLARGLAKPPKENARPEEIPHKKEADPQIIPQLEVVSTLPIDEKSNIETENSPVFPNDWRPDQAFAEGRQAFFEDLLSTVDVPEPEQTLETPESKEMDRSETLIQPEFTEEDQNDNGLARLAGILDTADTHIFDEFDLDSLIASTINEDVPEVDGYTANFGEYHTPSQIIEDIPDIPTKEDIPSYLTDVSLGIVIEMDDAAPEVDEVIGREVDPAASKNNPVYPIPDSLAELIMGQGRIDPKEKIAEVEVPESIQTQTLHNAESFSLSNDIATQDASPPSAIDPETSEETIAFVLEEDDSPQTKTDSLPDYLKETTPTPITEKELHTIGHFQIEDLEPPNPSLHNLTYGSILVPRLPQHHLVGDLAIYLNQWVMQLGLAFGWRLEHLATRPNYLHWVAVVPPATSPGHMVRNIREHTSQRIFAEFPRLARDNPSGDFWAPGYLIVNGKEALSHSVVQAYIGKTRIQQGTSKSHARITS